MRQLITVSGTAEQVFGPIFDGLPSSIVLDLATAGGGFIKFLQDLLPDIGRIAAVDIDASLLAEAAAEYSASTIEFSQMDAARLGFADNVFDLVNVSVSLHHLAEVQSVLNEVLRVILPGGYGVISEMYSDGQSNAQMSEVYLHHWVAEIDREHGRIHNQTLTRDEIISFVSALDWEEIKYYVNAEPTMGEEQPEIIHRIDEVIDTNIARAEGLPDFTRLREKGEWVRKWVHEHGVKRAWVLIMVCRKKYNGKTQIS